MLRPTFTARSRQLKESYLAIFNYIQAYRLSHPPHQSPCLCRRRQRSSLSAIFAKPFSTGSILPNSAVPGPSGEDITKGFPTPPDTPAAEERFRESVSSADFGTSLADGYLSSDPGSDAQEAGGAVEDGDELRRTSYYQPKEGDKFETVLSKLRKSKDRTMSTDSSVCVFGDLLISSRRSIPSSHSFLGYAGRDERTIAYPRKTLCDLLRIRHHETED